MFGDISDNMSLEREISEVIEAVDNYTLMEEVFQFYFDVYLPSIHVSSLSFICHTFPPILQSSNFSSHVYGPQK